MEMYEIARIAVFVLLIIMSVMDWKTRMVPNVFPFLPLLGALVFVTSFDWSWVMVIVVMWFMNALMWKTGFWEAADGMILTTSSVTMYTSEILLFHFICYVAILAISLYGKKKKVDLEVPFIPVIAVAYIVSLALV